MIGITSGSLLPLLHMGNEASHKVFHFLNLFCDTAFLICVFLTLKLGLEFA